MTKHRLKQLANILRQRRQPKIGDQQLAFAKVAQMVDPIYVFIRSWNRPLYLWACLDSLYRSTSYPCRFILIDNHSTDPQVRQIVAGFERRSFFHAVHWMDQNSPHNQAMVFYRYRSELGKYFVVLDADIIVEQTEPCWLTRLLQAAEQRPELAVLGSIIDTSDFIEPTWAQQMAPYIPMQHINRLIKANSPERRQPSAEQEVITPYKPAGRLLLLRTSVIDQVGLQIGNLRLCQAIEQAGYQWGIANTVRHRHLSLLNFFDYPDYDFEQLAHYLQGR